jgi:hypothetical protein
MRFERRGRAQRLNALDLGEELAETIQLAFEVRLDMQPVVAENFD